MDREPEDLQFLGIAGIVDEAFKILRSRAKLLGRLTFGLVLPLSCAILGYQITFQHVLFHWNAMPYLMETTNPADEMISNAFTLERAELIIFLAAYSEFVLAFWFVPTAAVVYTMASIYTSKEISYVMVVKIVPRVWKRLMGTFCWFSILVFVYCVACALFSLLLVCNVVLFNLNLAVLQFGEYVIAAFLVSGLSYINMVWHLACVTALVEDEYGVGAIRKSMELIKGKRVTALGLHILYLIFVAIIGWFSAYAVINEDLPDVLSARWVVDLTVLLGFLCFFHLMGLLTQSVLYSVCKSYHHESIDKSSLSDRLERLYLGNYEPLKSSCNAEMEDVIVSQL